MNSPDDDLFLRRIADAARELKRPAPDGMLEIVRARAADLDASIDVAARALAGRAPADSIDVFDVRIAAAARDLAKPAPGGLLDRILAESRETRTLRSWSSTRLTLLRGAAALAAALVLAATIFWRLAREDDEPASSALLTSAGLAQSVSAEARLEREGLRLEERVRADAALATSETAQSLLEEVAFLDQAIEELKETLELTKAHGHLRGQLVELTGRRVELLRRTAAIVPGADEGGPRG